MESKLLDMAANQGIWATLAIMLIFYVLKAQEKRDLKQEEREQKYQKIIMSLTRQLNLTEEIKEEVAAIKAHLLNNTPHQNFGN